MTVQEIYCKNRFLKMFLSFSKATLSYWKKVAGQYWDKVLGTQQDLFETFVIFFQRHLLAAQLNFVEFVKKKILQEFSEFCNIVLYFMICYSCHEVSSLQPIFSIVYPPLCISK